MAVACLVSDLGSAFLLFALSDSFEDFLLDVCLIGVSFLGLAGGVDVIFVGLFLFGVCCCCLLDADLFELLLDNERLGAFLLAAAPLLNTNM